MERKDKNPTPTLTLPLPEGEGREGVIKLSLRRRKKANYFLLPLIY
jgi:hypothetical protein